MFHREQLRRNSVIEDTYASPALPAIILPPGTFILTHGFRALSGSVLKAARLDGCSLPGLLLRVVLPMSKNALICVFLLSFLDAWNMVEQPITYLKEFADYPQAVAPASVPPGDPTVLLTACVLVALPPLFLFAFFNQELTEGIALGAEQSDETKGLILLLLPVAAVCVFLPGQRQGGGGDADAGCGQTR